MLKESLKQAFHEKGKLFHMEAQRCLKEKILMKKMWITYYNNNNSITCLFKIYNFNRKMAMEDKSD